MSDSFFVRPATMADVPLILSFIRGLAEFEKLLHAVTATEEKLRATLFGAQPSAETIIAFAGDEAVGFALFFTNYSTFLAQPGIYLEDLFVKPEWRGHGYGKRLLAHLARLATERDCGRLEWAVLEWNAPAIGFYERLGANLLDEWRTFRLTGDALKTLAQS